VAGWEEGWASHTTSTSVRNLQTNVIERFDDLAHRPERMHIALLERALERL
jgi:hypothetical protein